MTNEDIDDLAAAMAAVTNDDEETTPDSVPELAPALTPGTPRSRTAAKLVPAFDTAEGAGARVKRTVGTPGLWNLSPFLILDYARVRPGEGFPDHPHRGMATVTYVLEGMMQHEDFMGNAGTLGVGDVQWMTAGRGIVHSEMPLFDERNQDAVALQLWIDLPAGKKMVKPSYKERKAATLPRAQFDGGSVVVVSGESHGVVGPIRPIGGCWFLDYRLAGSAWQDIPPGWTAFVYVLEGSVDVEGTRVEPHTACVLSALTNETGVQLRAKNARFVLIAGEPLDQPMILQGPFVVTSKEAAVTALRDFQSGRNGFERALGWQSEIGKAVGMAGLRKKGKGVKEKGASPREEESDGRKSGKGKKRRE